MNLRTIGMPMLFVDSLLKMCYSHQISEYDAWASNPTLHHLMVAPENPFSVR